MSAHRVNIRLMKRPLMGVLMAVSMPLGAEFPLNFTPIGNSGGGGGWGGGWGAGGGSFDSSLSCNRPGETSEKCGLLAGSDPDQTPFLQELVNEGGRTYFHLIIGLPGQGFVQEVFIGTGGSSFGSGANSASGGQSSCMCSYGDPQGMAGNGWDPLRVNAQSFTGNATGNPTQVLIRQLINAPEITQEFLKDKYALKPKITQDMVTAELATRFVADMRNSNYSADSTPATVINTLTFTDPFLAMGNFNSAIDVTSSAYVTAGRYKYVSGGGSFGGAAPTYSYVGGSFNAVATNWESFRDTSQNYNLPKAGNSGKGIGGGGGWGGGW